MKSCKSIENKFVASMRGIALDSINNAKGGHIGMAIGAANITFALVGKTLNFVEQDPKWINRDRFVLSAGHGSMAYYSVLHFLNLLGLDEIKNHKKMDSKTPSHPEIDKLQYVDASTGPLGQGVAMAVGMALSQKYLQNRYNRKNHKIINHHIFSLVGDGCLQEGVALEAIQLAGTLKLSKLIILHDSNNAQIDSLANYVNGGNLIKFFESYNFKTFNVRDNIDDIFEAIKQAKKSNKPCYIKVNTTIAKGTPFENTPDGHNGTLNEQQTIKFKQLNSLSTLNPFIYEDEIYEYGALLQLEKIRSYARWLKKYDKYKSEYPELAKELEMLTSKKYKFDFSDVEFSQSNCAIRNYFAPIMAKLENNPYVVGGSADLTKATKIGFKKDIIDGGQNIKYGIREFAMSAINNGIYLDSNLKTIDSTFLAFVDYAKSALRLGAMMEIPSVHVYTHDSYQVGGDGPTHQPFDQIPMLRAMSNVKVIRPADESEVRAAFNYAFNQDKNQVVIIGCRQDLKSYNMLNSNLVAAYKIKTCDNYQISILASGSEVNLACDVASVLEKYKINAQVISVPLLQDLIENEQLCLELGLNKAPMFAIEATSDSMWYRLSKYNKIDAFLAKDYGFSADGALVYSQKGFTKLNISNKIIEFLK
ncbi:transketolase [Mycoplasmopsis caviae]|uniref:Transketolase n=1 Tax=Mycoplasmopsis caviae TaxID=55603 RepID=A0A3P8KWJ9_9BACT|nr:transketolase [Mycoplasmopsis caviae]UUD35426.1 transketolase [Mycoplasmopsis caviae]VDR41797.1 Transketolase [Mycoplasmopsis caviae]